MIFQEKLQEILGARNISVSAKKVSTFQIGGTLHNFALVESQETLIKTLELIKSEGLKYRVLGRGSNILFSDEGLALPIIKLGQGFNYINESKEEGLFYIGAATSLIDVSAKLSKAGWAGLEFAAGIPASVGGACFMNAGAHGSEISNLISSVSIITEDGRNEILSIKDLNFEYRHSNLPQGATILAVELKLTKSDSLKTEALRLKNLEKRRISQPLQYPSAGSIFKNPSGPYSAGWLIEKVGLKGTIAGGAMISNQHANWIVNVNRQAKSCDVLRLVDLAQKQVYSAFKINLELELLLW